jgi:hypothetical protein
MGFDILEWAPSMAVVHYDDCTASDLGQHLGCHASGVERCCSCCRKLTGCLTAVQVVVSCSVMGQQLVVPGLKSVERLGPSLFSPYSVPCVSSMPLCADLCQLPAVLACCIMWHPVSSFGLQATAECT